MVYVNVCIVLFFVVCAVIGTWFRSHVGLKDAKYVLFYRSGVCFDHGTMTYDKIPARGDVVYPFGSDHDIVKYTVKSARVVVGEDGPFLKIEVY